MEPVRATARYGRAIAATADLLSRLRIEWMFVGSVARVAWLGGEVHKGSLDLVALMTAEQKNSVAMMGSNRGFRVDRAQIEQSEELDLVPLNFVDPEGEVRVHVLLASNALYGRMFAAAVSTTGGDVPIRVAAAEDLALMMAISEDADMLRDKEMLIRVPGFDRRAFNQRLIAIGLPHLAIAE